MVELIYSLEGHCDMSAPCIWAQVSSWSHVLSWGRGNTPPGNHISICGKGEFVELDVIGVSEHGTPLD